MPDQAPGAPITSQELPPVTEAPLAWSVNPWRANWRRPAGALALIVFFALLLGYGVTAPGWWPQAVGWSLLSFVLLFGMTSVIFLPIRYKLDSQGVTVYFLGAPNFRPWGHYRNYYVHKLVVHLTTMPAPSALDPFRGHPLQYGPPGSPGTREAVVAYLARHIARPTPPAPRKP